MANSLTAEEATQQILDWVDRKQGNDPYSSSEENNLDELYDPDDRQDENFYREDLDNSDEEPDETFTNASFPNALNR